jgi:hypothetical protein
LLIINRLTDRQPHGLQWHQFIQQPMTALVQFHVDRSAVDQLDDVGIASFHRDGLLMFERELDDELVEFMGADDLLEFVGINSEFLVSVEVMN